MAGSPFFTKGDLMAGKEVKENSGAFRIVVDDGFVHVPMYNLSGDKIGEFSFQPTDVDIVNRFNESMEKFDEVIAPIEEAAEKSTDDGDVDSMAALNEARTRLFRLCDYIFNTDTGAGLFARMHPFSPVNGKFYCEEVFEQLGKFIQAQFGEETKKVNARLQKYVGRYTPSAPSKGRKK